MQTVKISTSSKDYPVFIGSGAIHQLNKFLLTDMPGITNISIIVDTAVADLYLEHFQSALSGFELSVCKVPSGEQAKTFDVYYEVMSFLLAEKLDRKSLILALGGGAIGDLAGFVAATYMRGIRFIQVPTTILAHDSAVGGKVAINHPKGKNMIGAFHQPEAVFYDLEFLASLPLKEKRSGFAEVIKHGLIHDILFYAHLRDRLHSLTDLSTADLEAFLQRGIEIKGEFVSVDETEQGIRAYLNFGHTLGHAIEAEMGYGGWTHGESVAVGMIFALYLSQRKLDLSFNIDDFKKWLTLLGYETTIPKNVDHKNLLERMKQDKKSIGQKVNFILLKEIGNPEIHEVSDEEILEELARF
ncbi:3-dehydroquinate synthase [Cytobacillus purgationiresistens]|uniref:3-dehydroquinate synthase n=1 Tax=Cytobacillus purgationiresistens TaxID=863449 RepID=A0ABU0AIJ3_9BACI|nr:3-dehydroquinate synthase [Cytobacillus purgationiresistens]MDQ0271077.1 3-dehydroquinate synthase [Cytobacillus purgationiresistens]